jgi:hypothetical protein
MMQVVEKVVELGKAIGGILSSRQRIKVQNVHSQARLMY